MFLKLRPPSAAKAKGKRLGPSSITRCNVFPSSDVGFRSKLHAVAPRPIKAIGKIKSAISIEKASLLLFKGCDELGQLEMEVLMSRSSKVRLRAVVSSTTRYSAPFDFCHGLSGISGGILPTGMSYVATFSHCDSKREKPRIYIVFQQDYMQVVADS